MKRVWLFDLDDTLHNAAGVSMPGITAAIGRYVQSTLQLSREESDALRRRYWQLYGATLIGLVRHHGVKAAHFLHETHVLPGLEQQVHGHGPDLAALRALRGRKYILTNAPRAYAQRVLGALGIAQCFDGLIAVEDMRMFGQLRPKPDARMFRRLAVLLKTPLHRCVLVEDTLAHQKAAHGLGLLTVWMQRWAHGQQAVPHAAQRAAPRLARRPAYVNIRTRQLQRLRRLPP